MFDLSLPEISRDSSVANYGRYRIEPLQPGWGTTLGSSLRRILTSSLVGAAVTGLRLSEMPEDPNKIPGIEENLIDLILNMKQICFRVPQEMATAGRQFEASLRFVSKLAGQITAGNLELPAGVEVVNPDAVIASASGDGSTFEMDLLIETGRGYGAADTHTDLPPDMIPVDAVYTPVPKVNYVVEHTRIGQITDYDRLLLEIWTDGTIQPDDALSQAARVLTQYATAVAGYGRDLSELGVEEPPSAAEDSLSRPIEELALSMRTTNALKRAGVSTVGQALAYNDNDLLHLRNFGHKSLVELRDALEAHGYEVTPQIAGDPGREQQEDIENDDEGESEEE